MLRGTFGFFPGTDMRHPPLHDDLISTPEGLKAALDDPVLRQYYITDGDQKSDITAQTYRKFTNMDQDGNVILRPLGGRRRVDYILFKEQDNVVSLSLLVGETSPSPPPPPTALSMNSMQPVVTLH